MNDYVEHNINLTGVVYFYEKAQSGEWLELSRLEALDSADGDFFGSYLKISGSVLAIGANGVTSPQVFLFVCNAHLIGSLFLLTTLAFNDVG